jgi:hypothetical protein
LGRMGFSGLADFKRKRAALLQPFSFFLTP